MATVSTMSKQEKFEAKVLKLANDLVLFRLPDGAADFLVESSATYFVLFEDRKVFGISFAVLREGHNILKALNGQTSKAYVFTESALVKSLDTGDAMTGPIVVPPHR
jgi:hypothetical protein